MNKLSRPFMHSIFSYKYYFASAALFVLGVGLFSAARTSFVPSCSNPHVIEKLKLILSAQTTGQVYSVNKVTSVFDVNQIESPTSSSRTCAAGVTIEGSELGTINYIITIPAPGSVEKLSLNTSLN